MERSERQLIIRFCQAEKLKSMILGMMQILLRLHDYIEHKKEEPDPKTLLLWFLNYYNNEITQAASISQSKELVEAQNLVADVIQKYEMAGSSPNLQQLVELLRTSVTKITTEASIVAKELQF